MNNTEFYKILGVRKNASAATIKKAFRNKAKTMHPDAGGNAEEFKKLREAYDCLMDPMKRERYDAGKDYTDNYQTQITEYILTVFADIITSDRVTSKSNVIDMVNITINNEIIKCKEVIKGIESKQKDMIRRAMNIKKKTDGPNIFNEFMDQKARELERLVQSHEKRLELFTEAVQVVNGYEQEIQIQQDDDSMYAIMVSNMTFSREQNKYVKQEQKYRFTTGV